MRELNDIKLSIIENVRARLPGIPKNGFSPDPLQGQYERPNFQLGFVGRKPAKDGRLGSIIYDYTFEVMIESAEDTEAPVETRADWLEDSFTAGEYLSFWHFVGSQKFLRPALMKVSKWETVEVKKDRIGNRSRGNLVITF